MKTAELWLWMVTDGVTGKRRRTRYRMSEADAHATDPTAERVPGTLELRQVPESPDEHEHTSNSAVRRP